MSIEVTFRKSKCADLKPYDYFAKEGDFVEMTEWVNGEGFDITLSANRLEQRFSLTWGEWQALQSLVAYQEEKTDGEK